MPQQSEWKWCNKCYGLYYTATPMLPHMPWIKNPGRCPVGDFHDSGGSGNYAPFMSETPAGAQRKWRWCFKCQGLFFGRNIQHGRCPAGGAHDGGQSLEYSIPFGARPNDTQPGWKWCRKCEGMFHSTRVEGGRCPSGGAHNSTDSNAYMMPWHIPTELTFREGISFPGGTPVGGWVEIAVNNLGHFTFSGHVHNSGFPNYRFVVSTVIMTRSGIGYGFQKDGHVEGTVEIFGRDRDEDWIVTGSNSAIAENWRQVIHGQLRGRWQAADTTTADLQQLLNDLAKDAARELAEAGLKGLVSLVI